MAPLTRIEPAPELVYEAEFFSKPIADESYSGRWIECAEDLGNGYAAVGSQSRQLFLYRVTARGRLAPKAFAKPVSASSVLGGVPSHFRLLDGRFLVALIDPPRVEDLGVLAVFELFDRHGKLHPDPFRAPKLSLPVKWGTRFEVFGRRHLAVSFIDRLKLFELLDPQGNLRPQGFQSPVAVSEEVEGGGGKMEKLGSNHLAARFYLKKGEAEAVLVYEIISSGDAASPAYAFKRVSTIRGFGSLWGLQAVGDRCLAVGFGGLTSDRKVFVYSVLNRKGHVRRKVVDKPNAETGHLPGFPAMRMIGPRHLAVATVGDMGFKGGEQFLLYEVLTQKGEVRRKALEKPVRRAKADCRYAMISLLNRFVVLFENGARIRTHEVFQEAASGKPVETKRTQKRTDPVQRLDSSV